MFIAALFIIAKEYKQPTYPSTDEWINKSQCIHTMEYYSVIKKNNHVKMKVTQSLFATPWTIQCMEFSRPVFWSGQPSPSPGDLPNPGIKPRSPTLQVVSLPAEPQGKPNNHLIHATTQMNPENTVLKKQLPKTIYAMISFICNVQTREI